MTAPDSDTATGEAVDVVQRPSASRFEVTVGGEMAGFAAYVDDAGRRIFYHTLIEDRFAGRGLAGRLVECALTQTAAAGLRIVPVCPYVAKYLTTHHDTDDAVDRVTPDAIAAVVAANDDHRP